jgi:phosphohistidine phosphatase
MRLVLVRHAIAEERDRSRWPRDASRPLTAQGRRKFRIAARGLARLLPASAVVLSSPFVRARQTAELLARALESAQFVECPELAAGQRLQGIFHLLRARREKHVVIVGHEPDLSALLGACVAGSARFGIEFKKGGAACVEFVGSVQAGRARLLWMLPPRVLRSLP